MNFLNIFKKEKILPPYFKRILWSYDFESIDPIKDKKTIMNLDVLTKEGKGIFPLLGKFEDFYLNILFL